MTRLDAIKAREQAATKGPWRYDDNHDQGSPLIYGPNNQPVVSMHPHDYDSEAWWEVSVADGTFLAHARTDLPWLLAQVEALAGALRQIDDIAAAHCRGAIGDAQYVARTALADLEEKG